jgi:hypothetical protein
LIGFIAFHLSGFFQMHAGSDTVGFVKAGGYQYKDKNEQDDGERNADGQRFCRFFGMFLGLVFNQMIQRGTQADDDQNKGNSYDALYYHGIMNVLGRISGIFGYSNPNANTESQNVMLLRARL